MAWSICPSNSATVGGVNLNRVIPYRTEKFVEIRDWRLGALQRTMTLFIFMKIVVVDIVYYNEHLKPFPVHGVVHTQMDQPTEDRCSSTHRACKTQLKPMSQLPYCQQGKGGEGPAPDADSRRLHEANHSVASEGAEVFEEDLPVSATRIERCEYWDAVKMSQVAPSVVNAMFAPTRVGVIPQEKGCEPSDKNGWSCDTLPFVDSEDANAPPPMFIANVEDYVMLINSAFRIRGKSGRVGDYDGVLHHKEKETDFELPGKLRRHHWDGEGKLKHAEDINIPKKLDPTSPFPSALSTVEGTYLTVGDLIRLADPRGVELLDAKREGLSTIRWDGALVEVYISYVNPAVLDPFGTQPPHYVISATLSRIDRYKMVKAVEHEKGRNLYVAHGLFFTFNVEGHIRRFDLSYLLQVLTTAMVSFAIAGTVTDFVMMYCMTWRKNYKLMKFQPTQDFGKFTKKMEKLQNLHGASYNPLDHKPMPHADILNDCATASLAKAERELTKEELLIILLKFEQRLNRLDGIDQHNALDTDDMGAKHLFAWEDKYDYSQAKWGEPVEQKKVDGTEEGAVFVMPQAHEGLDLEFFGELLQ